MKKTYIIPDSKEFKIGISAIIANSIEIHDQISKHSDLTKEEKQENTSIWDLY